MNATYYLIKCLKISDHCKKVAEKEEMPIFWTPDIEMKSIANRKKTPFPKTTPVRDEYECIELTPILRKSREVKAKVIKRINFDLPEDFGNGDSNV